MSPVLEMRGVSKRFARYADSGPALSDVTLSLPPGTATSLIGRNGAGKSTLLRVAAGIVAPTSGIVRRVERCASLIELGSAFHLDLTGTENLALGLALAGIPRRASAGTAEAIVDFAGLSDAMDTQMKHYSTGMVARLACSIAIHTDAQLLLVDEVLAVGDAAFQRRVLARTASLVERGAALLLVTHSPELAAASTERAVWIEHGRIAMDGDAESVLGRYQAALGHAPVYAPRRCVTIERLELVPQRIEPGSPLTASSIVLVQPDAPPIRFHAELRPVTGSAEAWMLSPDEPRERRHLSLLAASEPTPPTLLGAGRHEIEITIGRIPITPTQLDLSVVATDEQGRVVDSLDAPLTIGSSLQRPYFDLVATPTTSVDGHDSRERAAP